MNKFPENLPAKGTGKIDSQHRVAVLTEPEIEALNFLKNMDKAMGFRSGFSPMMQNLADQNTEPLDYVEYRGERIPSLNDFSEGGYGGGGDRGSDAGEQEARDQRDRGGDYGGSNDWAARERARKAAEKAAADKAAREAAEAKARWEEKQAEEARKAQDIKDIHEYLAMREEQLAWERQRRHEYKDSETRDDEAQDEASEEQWNYDQTGEAYDDMDIIDDLPYDDTDIIPEDDPPDRPNIPKGGLTDEEFNALAEEYGITKDYQAKDGTWHYTQGEADVINDQFTSARDTALGTLDAYGAENYGTDYISGLAEDYTGSFEGERQTEYDAALQGIYDDFMQTGVWDQTAYDEQLAAVDAGVLADQGLIDTAASTYTDLAQTDYDTWLATQTQEIQDLYGGTSLEDLSNWAYDPSTLDMSVYDPESDNYNPDLMNFEDYDFLEEFKKIYPSGTTTPGATDETGDETGDDSTTTSRSSVRTKKAKSKVPTYTSSPFSSGGSSSTIS